MKKVAHFSLVSEIPSRIIDQTAETRVELCAATGQPEKWMLAYIKAQIEAGKWEAVWKKVGKQIVPAYRRKKQS